MIDYFEEMGNDMWTYL